MKILGLFICLFCSIFIVNSQGQIGDFTSIAPMYQTPIFVMPNTHTFQYIIETGDSIDVGGTLPTNNDFTGYVPINNSSENGYLSINSEATPGGVTVLDINLDTALHKWNITYSEAIDFTSVAGTARNCSGGVTPWGTIITCEETISGDGNEDGYNDLGWAVEVDPASKTVIDKLWAVGNFSHENAVIHSNQRTLYQGADSNPGYLYKFVADSVTDLSSGLLYVYVGPKNGNGDWVLLDNTTQAERNATISQSAFVGGQVFNGVEDLEIGVDGKIYMAVKNENKVYRFDDSDPITGTAVSNFETFVGGMNYDITHDNGVTSESWGAGNDNLAFDSIGNLWVLQDGGKNYIWVVGPTHTQASPDVRIFGSSPTGAEPTGITFTPDYKYLMMSIQHPSSFNNSQGQLDAFGATRYFDKSVSLVIALNEDLGSNCPAVGTACDDGLINTLDDVEDGNCNCEGTPVNTIVDICNAITNGNNDAEEDGGDNSMYFNSTDLELVNDGNRGDQIIGLRFTDVQVPAGAIVTEAYIQFTTDETSSSTTSLTIAAQDIGNAEIFENLVSNISSRTKTPTVLNVAWSPTAWETIGEKGPDQQTPDMKDIIQHLVERSDYDKGNAMVIIISGTGRRTAESYDGSPGDAPNLCIKYKLCHTDLLLDSSLGDLSGTYQATNSITLSGPISILANNIINLKAPNVNIQNEVNISQEHVIISPVGCDN